MLCGRAFALDANDLLPPEKAFVPELAVADDGVNVRFRIADGYYMYQAKIVGKTNPADLLGQLLSARAKRRKTSFSAGRRFTITKRRLPFLMQRLSANRINWFDLSGLCRSRRVLSARGYRV